MPRSVTSVLTNLAHRLLRESRGQDMIEYALMAGTVAVVVAGFLPPKLMPTISQIFSKVVSLTSEIKN